LIKVECPASSNDVYPYYPPFGQAWETVERRAWEQNRPARDLARQATAINTVVWPRDRYLNQCRALANELGDAALYEHEQGRDAQAVNSIRDVFHMADLLDQQEKTPLVCSLVAGGCRATAVGRLMIVASNVALAADGQQTDALPASSAKELITALLDQAGADMHLSEILKWDAPPDPKGVAGVKETFRRIDAGRTLAAMSLASHLFYFQQNRWPNSAQEVASMLPGGLPKDPWGDGTQTFGYVLIKGGLPDGSDRPLVYDRCNSTEGMFFRVDQPEYCFYNGNGGQFYDVASWAPAATVPGAPATRPLP